MEKKKIWMAFCTVMIVLLTSTALSLRIENLMKIRVNTCVVVKTEEWSDDEEKIGTLPLSCYQWDEDSMDMVFYVEQKEGLFGEEYVASKKAVYPIGEKEEKAIVYMNEGFGEDGELLKIINEVSASRQIREGDLLIVDQEEKVEPVSQIWIVACLLAITIPGILLLVESVKKLGLLQEGNIKAGIEGMIFVLIWICGIFWLTGKLQIPRQYLPPEYIFDISFYMDKCREFHVWQIFKQELLLAGGFMIIIWGVTLAVSLCICRRRK